MINMQYAPYINSIEQQHNKMLDQLLAWSAINTGSYHLSGLARMHDTLISDLKILGGKIESLELPAVQQIQSDGTLQVCPLGRVIRIHKRPEAKRRILLCGHMDTVFEETHTFQTCHQLDDNTLNGPGVADMKGGLIVMMTALAAFEQSPNANKLGWEILINPDEEIGSIGSAALLHQSATNAHIGMIYEPALADGTLAGARKGSGNFTLVVRGKAAHAGREHHIGRNAIAALADGIHAIDALNNQKSEVTFNVGKITGGGAVNIVPNLAICDFNIRIKTLEDEAWCLTQLKHIVANLNERDGIRAELHGKFTRKPKLMTPSIQQLFELLEQCGNELGIKIHYKPTGGCCDGNNLAAAGLPNIDTLGVKGANIHSSEEYVKLDSLVERAQLSALLLTKLSSDDSLWPQRLDTLCEKTKN